MITKERLEELIKEKAIVWSQYYEEEVDLSNECFLVPLRSNSIAATDYILDWKLYVKEDEEHTPSYLISVLYENVEEQKFNCRYKNITRTETLSLPTLDEIKKYGNFTFKGKDETKYTLYYISGFKTLSLVGYTTEYYKEATKENYLEACEVAKKLFLGEEI